jgi:glycosyltransferase involved in cell wall biosynthesis/predicted flap endonuclease-1-like 5' DNA nuclease
MTIKVKMIPHTSQLKNRSNGIARVVEAYCRYLPAYGVEMIAPDSDGYDLIAAHAGATGAVCDVCHNHGLYWTADYESPDWEYRTNANVVAAIRHAREVTVPSRWVAETFKRDMRMTPHVIPHGIETAEWEHDREGQGYILWNKNRAADVCDPEPLVHLATRFPDRKFVTTFTPRAGLSNVHKIGVLEPENMKAVVQSCGVYLATTKETFGIGILEAMASGRPVLGYAHGGVNDLVQHNVNGYLAEPNNLDDLADGLAYCLQYADELGANGKELAKGWSWEPVCAQVADVYKRAMRRREPTVAIVIPTFNYASFVGVAIQSAVEQTYDGVVDVIVVNDGSTDDTDDAVAEWLQKDARVRYMKQQNQGVAVARNHGISETDAKYIVCLDADDWLDPHFVAELVPALEKDDSLGVAYTKIMVHQGDRHGKAKWPFDKYDYDEQVKGHNQVPTCCMFRRTAWERLGGYKQRYAPGGCGVEDAEFWLRMGAIGYGGKLVTDEPMFNYTFGGYTTTDRSKTGYKEPDWLAWHPWTRDGQHPFASVATPKRHSHPVRQYDESLVSVVIPVGPGHLKHLVDALDSLESQTVRKWEVIVVLNMEMNDEQKRAIAKLRKAYPYGQWLQADDALGAGYARNAGTELAKAPFLMYLDADDILLPTALESMLDAYAEAGDEVGVYSASYGTRTVSPEQANEYKQKGELLEYNSQTNVATVFQKVGDYDHDLATGQPRRPPYFWCYISTLHPRRWHDEVGGFDTELPSWEDWDYWIKIAKHGYPFVAVGEPLIVYNYDSGHRRERGHQIKNELLEHLTEKHKEIPTMPCRGCGSKRSVAARSAPPPETTTTMKGANMNDNDFVLCRYVRPKRGSHPLTGVATFRHDIQGVNMRRSKGGWVIDYGYHTQGDTFYVHQKDLEMLANWFVVQEQNVQRSVALPSRKETPKKAPNLLSKVEPKTPPLEIEDGDEPKAVVPEGGDFDLQAIPGVSYEIAVQLAQLGLVTPGAIVEAGTDALQSIKGVGKVRSENILNGAGQFLQRETAPTVEEELAALAAML